ADSYSRIDQIWTNISVTLLDYTDIVSELQLESDHQLITLELTLQISQSLPTKQKSRKCFQWKKCNKEQLEKYANQTYQSLQQKIEERNQTFKNSPKIFYRNILERYNNINIDRLNTNDNTLLIEQQQVQQAIHSHFTEYFNENHSHKSLQHLITTNIINHIQR